MESDPKATPINALPKGNLTQEDDQQFIQNILNQMKGDSQESEQNYQQAQQKYNNQQFGHNPAEQHERNQEQLQAQYEQEEQYEYEEAKPLNERMRTGSKYIQSIEIIGEDKAKPEIVYNIKNARFFKREAFCNININSLGTWSELYV